MWGNYETTEGKIGVITIDFGHSKASRPDKKQIKMGIGTANGTIVDAKVLYTSEIYRRIGMPDADSKRSQNFKPVIEQMRLKALELIEVCCIYDYVPVNVSGSGEILLANEYPVNAATSFFWIN